MQIIQKFISKSRNIINKRIVNWYSTAKLNAQRPIILGIETSCDDTGAALVAGDGIVLGESLRSQQNTHLRFGGIIPPIAQELHRQNIENVVAETFDGSNLTFKDIDAIAVTNRPGLTLSLQIGVRYAKYLCRTYKKPIIPIHHMEAHALTARLTNKDIQFPFLCLLASGGHCILTLVQSADKFLLLGETIDDAPGEALDKIARQLKLRTMPEYAWLSGGKAIEVAASKSTNPHRFEFPLPMSKYRNCQFSFAGLKNTSRRIILKSESEHGLAPDELLPHYEDFCAGFLRAITRHICHRTQRAIEYCESQNLIQSDSTQKTLVFSGGVACNDFIWTALNQLCEQFGYKVARPPKQHCTDNGLMIAWNGVEQWLANKDKFLNLNLDEVEIFPKCILGENITENVTAAGITTKWAKLEILRQK